MGENSIEFEHKPKTGRIILKVIASIVGLFCAVFLILFVYYLWQFKYGSHEKLAETFQKYNAEKFTSIGNTNKQGPKLVKDINSYIRKNNAIAGNPKGKITILAFVDFSCPYSQESHAVFNQMLEKYDSVAQIVIKHLPLTAIHPDSLDPVNAAVCANAQKKYFAYYDLLFKNLKFTKDDLMNYAEEAGLDTNKFTACLNSNAYIADIDQDTQDAIELGVRGTPTYFVNTEVIEGVIDGKTWDQIILRNLK